MNSSALTSIFLQQVDERRYALARIALGIAGLANLVDLWFYRNTTLVSGGMIDQATVQTLLPGIPFSIFSIFTGPIGVSIVFIITALATILLIGGKLPRVMLVIVYIFHVSVSLRAPLIISGWDGVITCWAFIMLFCPLAPGWGMIRLWRSRKNSLGSGISSMVPRFGLVLLQVQVAVIYWEAAIRRLVIGDQFWRDGSFMTYFLLSHHGRFEGTWPYYWQENLELLTHVSMLIELAIPILLWIPQMRGYGIIFGVLLHVGIAVLSINIFLFSLTILLMYTVFFGGKRQKSAEDRADL